MDRCTILTHLQFPPKCSTKQFWAHIQQPWSINQIIQNLHYAKKSFPNGTRNLPKKAGFRFSLPTTTKPVSFRFGATTNRNFVIIRQKCFQLFCWRCAERLITTTATNWRWPTPDLKKWKIYIFFLKPIRSIDANVIRLYDGWECKPKLSIYYRLNQIQNRL